jgi:hypothetical protein
MRGAARAIGRAACFCAAGTPLRDGARGRRVAGVVRWHQATATGDTMTEAQALRLGAPLELWVELVREGEQRASTPLPEMIESYLVFLLQRHQGDRVLAGRTLALEWLQGLDLVGSVRADALRDVGDRCLLVAGLYPQAARRRRVTPGYYAAIGQSAYDAVADATRAGYAELFRQLARAFEAMRRVLGGVAALPPAAVRLA